MSWTDAAGLQMARFLTLPVGTVKSRLRYARLALAKRLGAAAKKQAVAVAAKAGTAPQAMAFSALPPTTASRDCPDSTTPTAT